MNHATQLRFGVAASARSIFTIAAPLLLASALAAQDPVTEHWSDGTVRVRHSVDEAGKRHGLFEQFDRDGQIEHRAHYQHGVLHGVVEEFWPAGAGLRLRSTYRAGVLDGAFESRTEDGSMVRSGRYADGVLHGVVTVKDGRKTWSKQTWSRGSLTRLDDLRDPFPVERAALVAKIRAIERVGLEPIADEAPERAALRRLQAYRYLCRVPWEGMELNDAWNQDCAAAAEVGRLNGDIDHFPKRPPGVDDAFWARAERGARSSNLAGGGGLVGQVDGYMDDSDSSNIARVGHRRWCLNPAMRVTGFGGAEGYGAMWAFDKSGRGAKGIDAVLYPPPGYTPMDYFGAGHAWSATLLKGGTPRLDKLDVRVWRLDEHYVREAEPLALDHLGVAEPGPGTGSCIVFKPRARIAAGQRYLVEVRLSGGRRPDLQWLVEFCAPARADQD